MAIERNLAKIRRDIAAAASDAGREASAITLVAVSKKQPDARIDAALAAGVRVFGENRVQEAATRWQTRRARSPDLELRLVGALQTNKVADAVALFDVIESLDREKLARALADEAAKQGRKPPRCFIQVNTGEEAQKSGIAPNEAVAFSRFCRDACGLAVEGLMCIPPRDEAAAMHFALLHDLAKEAGLKGLSMGMSADYEQAIAFGATHIRIGTALFGARED